MNGGGDTPLPTLENFYLKLNLSKYYICDKEGNYVRFSYDGGNKVFESSVSDGSGFSTVNATGMQPAISAVVTEDSETGNLTLSMDGYNTLTLVYNDDEGDYAASTYVPIVL